MGMLEAGIPGQPESAKDRRQREARHFVLESVKSAGGISLRSLEERAREQYLPQSDVIDAYLHLMAGYPIEGQFGGLDWEGKMYLDKPQVPQEQTGK